MYQLYYSQGTCALATQIVLRELNQEVKLVDKTAIEDFKEINPVGTVPTLISRNTVLTEGAAIILYLLKKHPNNLLPSDENDRQTAIQNIMFANATMHPAYSKLFFAAQNITDENAKLEAFTKAAEHINDLWQVVEKRLGTSRFLGGDTLSAADIMLTVYSRWGDFFPVNIIFGDKTESMLSTVKAMANFEKSIQEENAVAAALA